MDFQIESANINLKWIENIYDNLKKIEEYERLAREGCVSILEYVQTPIQNRSVFLAEVQYKNLRLLMNEFILVVPDIVPVIGEEKAQLFFHELERLETLINKKEYFVSEYRSTVTNKVENAQTTELFNNALKVLHNMRVELIKLLKNILYMEGEKRGKR